MTQINVYKVGEKRKEKREVSLGDCFMSDGGRIVMVCKVAESDFRLIVIGGLDDATIGGFWREKQYTSLKEVGDYVFNKGFKKYIVSMEIEINRVEAV